MKKPAFALLSCLSCFAALYAITLHAETGSAQVKTHSAQDSAEPVAGVVRKIDKATARLTVSHGPLPALDRPAMTAAFRVKNAEWLDRVKPGDAIRFVAEPVGGALTIVYLEPAETSK